MDHQKRLSELRAKKAEAVEGMNAIQELVSKESRKRSAEEKAKFDDFSKEAEEYDEEIRSLEKTIQHRSSTATKLVEFKASNTSSTDDVESRFAKYMVTGKADNSQYSAKDVRTIQTRYRVANVFKSAGSKGKLAIDGLEAELHQEGIDEARKAGIELNPQATYVPYSAMRLMPWSAEQRNNLQATVATLGAESIETDVLSDQYLQALRPQNILLQAGTRMFSGLTNNIAFTRETAVFQPAWTSTENAAASQNAGTFGQILYSPKRLSGYFDVSMQLLSQAGWIEPFLREQILLGVGEQLDIAGINGSGASGVPPGILNTAGIGSEVGGTNGAPMTRAMIVDMEQQIGTAGANVPNAKWVTNWKVAQYLKKTEFSAGSGRYLMDGAFIWNGQPVPTNGWVNPLPILEYYPVYRSAHVPSTLTKGTSSGNCSAIILGDFQQSAFGQWGGLQILADPYTQATTGNVRYVVNVYADFHVLKPNAFVAMVDALTP